MLHFVLINSSVYITIFLSISLGLVISGVVLTLSYLIAIQAPDSEKTSSYECGFEPFEDARNRFDVRFYIVAILFIIFDLEVVFLFP
jgi:NADH-quinone oxidoreductase subunit A